MCIRDSSRTHTHKVYHSFVPQVTHQNCNSFSPSLILFHTSTHTFHITPLNFTFSFIFVSVTASKSNLPFLNTSITSLLFSSTFIPLTFHVPIRFIQFRRKLEGRLRRSRPSPRPALAFLARNRW